MAYELHSTENFEKWLKSLKDRAVKNKILARLDRVENGNFGDFKSLNDNLFELRFFFGNGLRIYYTQRNKHIVLLLKGGDKTSQSRDIKQARKLIEQLE